MKTGNDTKLRVFESIWTKLENRANSLNIPTTVLARSVLAQYANAGKLPKFDKNNLAERDI